MTSIIGSSKGHIFQSSPDSPLHQNAHQLKGSNSVAWNSSLNRADVISNAGNGIVSRNAHASPIDILLACSMGKSYRFACLEAVPEVV